MKLHRIQKVFVLSIAVLSCFAAIEHFDHKAVRLEYVGKAVMNPPISSYSGVPEYYWTLSGGKYLKKEMEKELLPWIDDPRYSLKWDNIVIDKDARYCICVGCEIESIAYYYHTKYTNSYNNPSLFIIDSISHKPLNDKSIIMIYTLDVNLTEMDF